MQEQVTFSDRLLYQRRSVKLLLNFHGGSYVKIPHNSKLASLN